MRKLLLVAFIGLMLSFKELKAEKLAIQLNNALLSTAVEAIAQISKYNILWDKDTVVLKIDLSVLIYKNPLKINRF